MEEPILEVDQIQGNVIPGFRLPHQCMFACKVQPGSNIKSFLETILPQVTTTREALEYKEERLTRAAAKGIHGPTSFSLPDKKHFFWLNLGFSNPFLRRFNTDAETVDNAFRIGMAGRSPLLGDPTDLAAEGHKGNWLFGGDRNPVDIFLITGSDDKNVLEARCNELQAVLINHSINIVYTEQGNRLDEDNEHFGFKDGISQPAVRGYIDEAQTPLYPREIESGNDNPSFMEFAYPGKPLIWPGQFVFGYPKQSPNHFRVPLEPTQIEKSPFLKNGSFLVVRRLKQKVDLFEKKMHDLHFALVNTPGFASITFEDFTAMLVGRHKDGKPAIVGNSLPSDMNFNNFNYKAGTTQYILKDGTRIDPVPADPGGSKCPMFAHIRKVNPRDMPTDQGAETNTATFGILRRGIPFGPPFNKTEPNDPVNLEERGLLFVCYQSSIQHQFELLASKWMNEDSRPEARKGFDLIVGQNNEEGEQSLRWCQFQNNSGQIKRLETMDAFVVPTGGGYFFCPSIDSLQSLIALL